MGTSNTHGLPRPILRRNDSEQGADLVTGRQVAWRCPFCFKRLKAGTVGTRCKCGAEITRTERAAP